MKRLILILIIAFSANTLFAKGSDADTTVRDSVKMKKGESIKFGYGDDAAQININKKADTITEHHHSGYPRFSFGITIARLDLGLATLVDNGSFTLRPQNQFLRYRSWKTSNPGFDLFQFSARFNDSFKLYLAAGFDWTNIRLRENVTILPNQPSLTYVYNNLDLSKNRFNATYLRLPLSFDFRTREDANGTRFHFVVGPEAGFLLTASVKQISTENGKQKIDDTYNFTTFRYGAVVRVGYGAWGIFAKYYFNNMFENSPDQDGLHDFAFGIMLGF